MIGFLRGQLLDRLETELLVEVAGVGYRVKVSTRMLRNVGAEGSEVMLHVYHHRNPDVEAFYGFASIFERRLFEAMLAANRVGPALAMSIMETHEAASLQRVLQSGDVKALTLVPGVGPKTAQRLLVELQACLDVPGLAPAPGPAGGPSDTHSDLREALVEMGFELEKVAGVLAELPEEESEEELLRQAMQALGAGS